MLNRAKRAVEKKEAQIRGDAWLAEVCDDDGQTWKPFSDWANQYEPKKQEKPESEAKKAAKAKAAAKVKQVLLETINVGVSKKLMLTILELTSTVLSKAESRMPSESGIPKFLNSSNAIVLSYRFGNKKKSSRKFVYMRRVASGQLTDSLHKILEVGGADVGERIRSTMRSGQNDIRKLVSAQVDMLLKSANAKLDEKVEKELADPRIVKADEKLKQLEVALSVAGVETPGDVQKAKGEVISQGKQQKDDLVEVFSAMFKDLLIGKLLHVADMVADLVNTLLQEADKILSKHKSLTEKSREDMFELIEKLHSNASDQVANEVQRVVGMMGGMMDSPTGEDDEEEEEEE